jgi:hypothetical protein
MDNETISSGKGTAVFSVRLGDWLLSWVKSVLTPARFEVASTRLEEAGHGALVAAAAAGLLYAIIESIKTNTLSDFLMGIGWVLLVALAQYVAGKLSAVERMLIKTSPSELSSTAFLSCVALLNLVAGILALTGFTVMALRVEEWGLFGEGVGIFVLCELVVCLCLNPEMINMTISSSSNPGQEAIGVLTFAMKSLLRLVPIAFGVGTICGAVGMMWMVVQALRGEMLSSLAEVPAASLVLASAALPLVSYLLYILWYLGIDLMRSLLILPGKVDALKDTNKQSK